MTQIKERPSCFPLRWCVRFWAGELVALQAWWFDVTMRLLKYFPWLSQLRDASQGPL